MSNKRSLEYISENFDGPCTRTVRNWISELISFEIGVSQKNIEMIGKYYSGYLQF